MKMYLIRHGQSAANRGNIIAGHQDVPLTEVGHAQAALVVKFFEGKSVDAIYSSDLSRAMDTVRPLATERGLTVQPERGLRELHAGVADGMAFAEFTVRYPETYAVWMTDFGNLRCPGGESMTEVAQRADATLRRIAAEHPDHTVAVATHGGVIRALLSLWTTGSTAAMPTIPWAPNAAVTEVTFADGAFRVDNIGITTHLGELITELPKTI